MFSKIFFTLISFCSLSMKNENVLSIFFPLFSHNYRMLSFCSFFLSYLFSFFILLFLTPSLFIYLSVFISVCLCAFLFKTFLFRYAKDKSKHEHFVLLTVILSVLNLKVCCKFERLLSKRLL